MFLIYIGLDFRHFAWITIIIVVIIIIIIIKRKNTSAREA